MPAQPQDIIFFSSELYILYLNSYNFSNVTADQGIAGNVNERTLTMVGANALTVSDAYGTGQLWAFANGWDSGANTKSWRFSFSTTNSTSLAFSCKMAGTTSFTSFMDPRDFKLQYSLNGTTWTDISGGTLQAGSATSTVANFTSLSNVSLPAACENQPIVYLQMLMTSNTGANGSSAVTSTGQSHIDDILVTGVVAAASPTITSTTYNASTGALAATAANLTTGDTITVGNLTLTGEGGTTYTLTSSNVTASSATAFSVTLNATDKATVNQILNKNGASSTGGTTYNLAAATNWDSTASAAADLTGNGITVSNVAVPTITSATYNANTEVLTVTGTGLLKKNGTSNDIDGSKLTISGDATAYTLTSSSVEVTSGTSFSVTLNATDKAALLTRLNKNGTSSVSAVTYNLAAAEDWAAGADAAVVVADLTGNGITVSNAAVAPTLGNYATATVTAGNSTTVTPAAVPTNTTSATAYTSSNFKGVFSVDPTTGIVRVTNAQPAGTYTVTVAAFGTGGTATKTFTLTVNNPSACTTTAFSGSTNVAIGSNPFSVTTGDFNGDGKLDFAAANFSSGTLSIRLNSCVFNPAPTITAGSALARTAGSAASNASVATVSDTETAAGSLTVTATTVPTGLTISNIINTNGTITADVAAGCTAVAGVNTIVFTVTDGGGATATANLTVNVASSAISIGTPPATQSVSVAGSVTFSVSASNAVSYQWRKGGQPINNATASSYTINPVSTNDAGNYDVVITGLCGTATSDAATLTVNKRNAMTTLASSKTPATFGESVTFTASVSGTGGTATGSVIFKDGSTALGTGTLSNGQATLTAATLVTGAHSIAAEYSGDSVYNSGTSAVFSQTVTQAGHALTWNTPASIPYGTALSATQLNATSSVAGTFSYSPALSAVLNAGTHTLSATFTPTDTVNYQTLTTSVNLTVTKGSLTFTAENKARLYGASNPTLTYTVTGFTNGDTANVLTGAPALTTTATAASNIGSYAITAAVGNLSANNYSFVFVDGTLTVSNATLTMTAENKTRVYGAANPALTVTYSGFVNGDTAAILSGAPVLTTTATAASNVGNYAITAAVGTLSAAGYTLNFVDGTMAVTKAPLTDAAANQARLYGAANPALTGTLAGIVNNESITANYATVATTASGIGSYAITPTMNDPGSKLGNYEVTSTNGALNVMPATVTVTAESKARTYGTTNPTFTAAYTGFVNGETATVLSGAPALTTTAINSSNVGSYPITAAVETLTASNYQFTYSDGALTINKAVLTVKTDDATRQYGTANPTFTTNITGFVNTEMKTVLGGELAFTTTATQNSAVGNYPVTPSGLTSGNYEITYQPGTLNITTQTLTVKAEDKTKMYGSEMPALTYQISGFSNSETASVLNGAPELSSTVTARSNVGNYPIKIAAGTLQATNYDLVFTPGQMTVTSAPLTVAAEARTRPYGTANPTLTASFTGLVNGDTMNLTAGNAQLMTSALPNSPAGTYPIIASGVTNPNYTVTYVAGTLTITSVKPGQPLTASRTPAPAGHNVTFTVSTQPTTPFGGIPGGAVTFSVDGKSLSPFVLNVAGQASFTSSSLGLGAHTITADYGGDNNYQSGAKELSQEVIKATSFTTLTTAANPVSNLLRLALRAQVKGLTGQPQGQVEFFDGQQSLGIAPLKDGIASLLAKALPAGEHALSAVYQGDETFAGSTSAIASQQVTAGCTFIVSQQEILAEPRGGKFTILLEVTGDCTWNVENTNPWIDMWSPIPENGKWVITFVVAAQTEANMRVGKFKLAGQEITVTQSRAMATVQAASYDAKALARDSMASMFGTNLASGIEAATAQPLPTKLGEVRVKLRDTKGKEEWAGLLYVSPRKSTFWFRQTPSKFSFNNHSITMSSGEVSVTGTSPFLRWNGSVARRVRLSVTSQ